MKTPVKDCTYARDAFPLGEGDACVGQVVRAVEGQAEVFGWIRRRPILRLAGVVPHHVGRGTDGDAGIDGEEHGYASSTRAGPHMDAVALGVQRPR